MNVYDFDDTIYDGDSSFDLFKSYFKKDPALIRYVPVVLKVLRNYRKGKARFEDFINNFGCIFEDYFRAHDMDMDVLVKEFWDKNEKKIKPWYKKVQKEDDVIITATPAFMMGEICNRLGVKYYLGTEFDVEKGKFLRGCFRERKIEFFREAFPDGVIDDFYTDSYNDKFLFPYAKRVFIVKGEKITRIK